jgi:hypothetical protein
VDRVLAFSRQFCEMIDAGISLVRCFTDLAERQDDPEFKDVLSRINEEVQAGQTLSRSLAQYPRYFDERYAQAVKLGEITGTLEFQLQRLAAGHAFDFADLDSLQRFRPESPTVIYSAEWSLRHAIRDGITEIHFVLYEPPRRMHRELAVVTDRIDLVHGITLRCVRSTVRWISDPESSLPAVPGERYQDSLPAALYARCKQLAGINAAKGKREGRIDLQAADGTEYAMPVTLHPTSTGETLVIVIRVKAKSQS